jgi:hypothetical protein
VTEFGDARGPNVRVLRQAQRRLSPPELEALIAEYEAGVRVCTTSVWTWGGRSDDPAGAGGASGDDQTGRARVPAAQAS